MNVASPISLATAALAVTAVGALYALHHLRSQPQRKFVATLMFWGESARAEQTRVPWSRRFRHLKTFLLLCGIVALLSAVLSADRWTGSGEALAPDVVVIDIGSSMATSDDNGRTLLSDSIDAALTDVAKMGRTPMLIAAGTRPALLSPGDEPVAIFGRRLANILVMPEGSASLLALDLAGRMSDESRSTIYWYTDHREPPAGLPPSVARRVRIRTATPPAQAVAIVGATFEPAADRDQAGTLQVKIAGRCDRAIKLVVRDGDVLLSEAMVEPRSDQANVLVPGMVADGRELSLSLADAPGSPLEHAVSIRLPNEPPLRFYMTGSIPAPLQSALGAVGHFVASPAGSIIVAGQGAAIPQGGIGVIELSSSVQGGRGRIIVASEFQDQLGDIDFEGATAAGASAIDGDAILKAGDSPAATWAVSAAGVRLKLASAVVDEAAELPRHAAFPVLIERLARRIAGWQSARPTVTPLRQAMDPLWQRPAGVCLVYDRPISTVTNAKPQPAIVSKVGRRPIVWAPVLIASGLVLTLIEGILLARRKII